MRACYIDDIWMQAHLKVPSGKEPSQYGWKEVNNEFNLTWFAGS